MTFGLGVAAATAAPLVMTLGFIAWENHWKGSAFALNLFKCNLASMAFLIMTCTTRSNPFPSDVFTTQAVGYLFLSSTIGIVIGDWTWLEALQLLGARRVILMDSVKPFLAAFFGWLILDEELRPAAVGGIALTVVGVLVVSLESTKQQDDNTDSGHKDKKNFSSETNDKPSDEASESQSNSSPCLESVAAGIIISSSSSPMDEHVTKPDHTATVADDKTVRDLRKGYPYAILNVALDTYGSVLTKQYGQDFKVWEINLLRFGFAGLLMAVIAVAMSTTEGLRGVNGESKQTPWYALPLTAMTRSSWGHVCLGVLLVTFATPSLSNYALFEIALGLALTLGSIGPIYSIPLTYLLQNEVPTVRGVLGAFLAVAGVAVLTWKGTIPDS